MAEPSPRAGRKRRAPARSARRSTRALLLAAALLALAFGGLFAAGSASAATTSPAATASTAATTGTAATDNSVVTTSTVDLDSSICNVPGIGDVGGLLGLCSAGSGIVQDVNNICAPTAPTPELASSGIDALITVPESQAGGTTLYDEYGMAGTTWAAYGLDCSQMTSLIGNNVAGMVFDMAKSLDRVTITVYQTAASANILSWLSNSVDTLITDLGNAIYFPYLAVVVLIGALWLAWQGLVRKRATRTIEGTIWMIVAAVMAIWLIGQPQDFTGVGTDVSNGVTAVLNTTFAKLPPTTGGNCLPGTPADPDATADYSFTTGNGMVDQNANELWSVLVCEPWLDGELGTTAYATPGTAAAQTNLVNEYGWQLLQAQAVAADQTATPALVTAKTDIYEGIATQLQTNDPAVYSLFQGDQWTDRLEIGFSALFAAVAAGLLVLLIALTLILLKLGFLLLLVAGPFFLIVGTHPGFGRVVAIRWLEMLVGVLLKQIAIALTLSVLLYCYSLIMGTSAAVLPWALKIIMIALVTVAVFIYRKPFQHLFSSVGYGMIGRDERAEISWRESTSTFRRVTSTAAGVAIPSFGASRWARRSATGTDGSDAAAARDAAGATAGGGDTPSTVPTADSHTAARQWTGAARGSGGGRAAPPLPLPGNNRTPPAGASTSWARGGASGAGSGTGRPTTPPVRSDTSAAPPSRTTSGSGWPGAVGPGRSSSSNGAAGGSGQSSAPPAPAAQPPAAPFWARNRRRSK